LFLGVIAMSNERGGPRSRDAALDRLVDEGVLSRAQADAVRAALAAAGRPARHPSGWLMEIAGYLGGGLMLGGVALFLAASWDTLSRAARSGLLAGFAVLFVVAAVVISGGIRTVRRLRADRMTARRRIVGVLLALASVPAAAATGVALDHYAVPVAATVGFVVAAAGLAWLSTPAGVVAAAGMSVFAVAGFGGEADVGPMGMGLLLLGLGVAWVAAALLVSVVAPAWLGLAIGAGLALVGAQQPLAQERTMPWAYGLTGAVALACFLLYRWRRHLVLLVAGVVGATIVVPEAVADVTNGALGGSLILLVAGVVLIAFSAVGLRLRAAGGPPGRPSRPA
jgi:Predicted membrane protein (DUF2157)